MSTAAAAPSYSRIDAWRYIWSASVHNCWILALPMLIVLSHRNVIGALVLMVLFGTVFQPGLWRDLGRVFLPGSWRPGTPSAILAYFLAFCGYVVLSVLWTPLKEEWIWAVNLILFFLVAAGMFWTICTLPGHIARLLGWFLFGAGLVAILSLGVEAATGGLIRDLIPPEGRSDKDIVASGRGVGITILILPGFLYLAWEILRRASLPRWSFPALLGTVLACLALGAVVFDITANAVALVMLVAAGLVALWRPRPALYGIAGCWALAFLLAPVIALMFPPLETLTGVEGGPVSWLQRLGIWRYTADHVFASPLTFLFGHGVNASEALSDAAPRVLMPGNPEPVSVLPSHPHNLFLHVWLEFGVVGAAVMLGALWLALKFCLDNAASLLRPTVAAAWVAMAAAFLVFATLELSIWTVWRLAAPVWGLYFLIAGLRLRDAAPAAMKMS